MNGEREKIPSYSVGVIKLIDTFSATGHLTRKTEWKRPSINR